MCIALLWKALNFLVFIIMLKMVVRFWLIFIVKNGRARLVYDSFWSQGPPRLQKIGLGWFLQLARPLRADLRNFPNKKFGNFTWAADIKKKWFFWLQSPKKWSKINLFSNFFDFSKNMELQLQNGIFTSVVLPIDQNRQGFEILISTFPKRCVLPYFEKLSITHL